MAEPVPPRTPAALPEAEPAGKPAADKPALPARQDQERPTATTRKTWSERRAERREHGRRQKDLAATHHRTFAVPTVTSGTRTENAVAVFLLLLIVGCAGLMFEHDRCPGALKTAATAAAPLSISLAVPLAVALAWTEKHVSRAVKIRRAVIFSGWAALAALSVSTAALLWLNERGPIVATTASCEIQRRDTVPAVESGVQDWVLVLSCSDRMSAVSIDVDRARWWAHEPGGLVDARLARGAFGYQWVVDVPGLGSPRRLFY